VFTAGRAASERFPNRYRAIVWRNEANQNVDVILRDGDNVRESHYLSRSRAPYHLPVPCTADEVLKWTQSQLPVGVTIAEGEKKYRRRDPHAGTSPERRRKPKVRVTRSGFLMSSGYPYDKPWPYLGQKASWFEVIQNLPPELSGCIGLRRDFADIRREMYIDPAHDYICVKWIWWKLRSGNWEKHRQSELSDFKRLPGGHWYASTCRLTMPANSERGTPQTDINWSIDIHILDEHDYPHDVFNGEKLMEGAEIETY
jgi:hypothetical protein